MRASQLLLVPALIAPMGAAYAAKKPETVHQVKKGETASMIARKYGMPLARLSALNPKVRISKLSPGMTLKVIGSRAASETPEAPVDALETEIVEARKEPLAPVPALPTIPSQAPTTLIHLERVLPNQVGRAIPVAPLESASPAALSLSSSSALPLPRSVFLPSSGLEYESAVAASLGFEPADPSQFDLLWPVETRTVSSAWGPRIRTRTVRVVKASVKKRVKVRYHGSHKGVDLTAPTGTNVYAALDGRVILACRHRQYGNVLLVDHGNGLQTLYAHNCANYARLGDIVQRGQKIAEVGRTGNATGPHLHFELRVQGQPHNPLPYLNDIEEIPAELVASNNALSASAPRH